MGGIGQDDFAVVFLRDTVVFVPSALPFFADSTAIGNLAAIHGVIHNPFYEVGSKSAHIVSGFDFLDMASV